MTPGESPAGVRRSSWRTVRGFVAAGTLLSLLAAPLSAAADPTPEPAASSGPAAGGRATRTAPPSADPSPSPSPSPSPNDPTTATTPPASAPVLGEQATAPFRLTVSPAGTPVPGHYYEDIGRFAIAGSAGVHDASATIAIYRRPASGSTWTKLAEATADAAGDFSAAVPVTERGSTVFIATVGGSPTSPTAGLSNTVSLTVENTFIALDRPAASIDALKDPVVTGRVAPARPGVTVIVEVQTSTGWLASTTTTTTAAGTYATSLKYGHGLLATYPVRTRYVTDNRPTRSEASTTYPVTRVAVINAVVTSTTAAEVAETYRAGCPVGPSKLRTISLNYYGFDQAMHRGAIIVRKDLTIQVIRGFSAALKHRYPVASMNNPNVYGGIDEQQMAADNTSGFNCRKVVGNPYKMSPHSYGIALDVNTVQNPYRDATGTWWPTNGQDYIKRTPMKPGMLDKNSYLTRSLRKDRFFWGGFWSPGKDYQHFEYRG